MDSSTKLPVQPIEQNAETMASRKSHYHSTVRRSIVKKSRIVKKYFQMFLEYKYKLYFTMYSEYPYVWVLIQNKYLSTNTNTFK